MPSWLPALFCLIFSLSKFNSLWSIPMYQVLISCKEAAIAAIPLVPIFLILHRFKFQSKSRSSIYLILAIYLAAMYAAVGLPDVTYYRYYPRFNFDPFLYMFSAWETTLLNVLLFLPLGWFLPVLWKKFQSPLQTVCFGFNTSFAVELLQIFTYRATDVNDLMTNTFGTVLGYILGIVTLKVCPKLKAAESHMDLFWVLGAAFFVMFFIYPFLSMLIQ